MDAVLRKAMTISAEIRNVPKPVKGKDTRRSSVRRLFAARQLVHTTGDTIADQILTHDWR